MKSGIHHQYEDAINTFLCHSGMYICADGNNEMYKQYLLTQSQCTCKFEKIHEDDILKIINKMDNKSSSGYDMFSNKIIKAIKMKLVNH